MSESIESFEMKLLFLLFYLYILYLDNYLGLSYLGLLIEEAELLTSIGGMAINILIFTSIGFQCFISFICVL